MVRFEKERTALVHQEAIRDLKRLQLDQEKHHKKVGVVVLHYFSSPLQKKFQVEVLTQELWSLEKSKEVQVKGLEAQLQDLNQRLQGYEKIEKELDDIVMQSAQSKGWREGWREGGGIIPLSRLQWKTPVKQRKCCFPMGLVLLSPPNPNEGCSRGEFK